MSTAQGSGLHGHLGFDIVDQNQNGQLVIGEGVELVVNALAYAEVDMDAVVSTTAGAVLPSVSTTIHYDQQLSGQFSTSSGASFEIGSPQVQLENVTLNVGSVFDSFLGDTLETINDIVKPIKPVVDLLTTEIDLGVAKVQLIDLAYLKLPPKTVDLAKTVLTVIKDTIDFLDNVVSLSTAGGINFGNFDLTKDTVQNPDTLSSDEDVASSSRDDSNLTQQQKDTLAGPNQHGLTRSGSSSGRNTSGQKPKLRVAGQSSLQYPRIGRSRVAARLRPGSWSGRLVLLRPARFESAF